MGRLFYLAVMCVSICAIATAESGRNYSLPDIMFVAVDTLRADHLGCYGYSRQTSPHIDKLAAQGVLFENCYSAASWTIPSFASMFTGLLPSAHQVCDVGSDGIIYEPATIIELLQQRGYFTVGVVSSPMLSSQYGFDRGFTLYDDYSYELSYSFPAFNDNATSPSSTVTGWDVLSRAKNLYSYAKAKDRPVFMFTHFMDVHDDYTPPRQFRSKFLPADIDVHTGCDITDIRNAPPLERELRQIISYYDCEIAFVDSLIGDLCEHAHSLSDNLLIVLVSDHGEAFGEHGYLLHGNLAFREEVHIPMIWQWTNVLPKSKRITVPVSAIDFPMTLKEIIGSEDADLMQGVSLWDILNGRSVERDGIIIAERACLENVPHEQVSVRSDTLSFYLDYVVDDPENVISSELFDIIKDYEEKYDIKASRPDLVKQMNSEVMEILEECYEIREYLKSSEKKRKATKLSEQELERIRTMGYIK